MHEPNITRTLTILGSSGTSILEWQFHEKTLFISPDFFSIIDEPAPEEAIKPGFLLNRLKATERHQVVSSLRSLSAEKPIFNVKFRLKTQSRGYIWFKATGRLFTDDEGKPLHLTFSLTDIHSEKKALESLRLTERRLDLACEYAEICLWELYADRNDPESEWKIWWSDSFYSIFDYSKKEITTDRPTSFPAMHPDDRKRMPHVSDLICDGQSNVIDYELRIKHKQKGYLWHRCLGYGEQLDNGRYRALGAVININDLKIAQREAKQKNLELERTNEELEHFAYAASHDLKAPLRGLKSLAEWISEDIHEPTETLSQNLQLMHKRVTRMENMLADILAYSKAGRQISEFENIDLNQMIQEIWDCSEPPEGFELRLDLSCPHISAPKTMFEQTFSNLISNAIKHHDGDRGIITIHHEQNEDNHQFSVADDGPGISPRFHSRIFRIFQTLRPRDEVEGSGVGLAIVKKNVESLGGSVWIESGAESESENTPDTETRGSCFYFTLPQDSVRMSGD